MTRAKLVTCDEARHAAFEAMLGSEACSEDVSSHLETCATCRPVAEEMAADVARRRADAAEPLPAELEARVWKRMRGDGDPAWVERPGPLTRVWDALSMPRLVAGGALAGVAAAAIAWLVVGRPIFERPREASPIAVRRERGGVTIARRTDAALETVEGTASLRNGDRMQTGEDGEAKVSVAGHTCIAFRQTTLRVRSSTAKRVELELDKGVAAFRSDPTLATASGRLRVVLPRATVDVLGTVFWLESTADHDDISVYQGRVSVTLANTRQVVLSDGQQLRIGAGAGEPSALNLEDGRRKLEALGLLPLPTPAQPPAERRASEERGTPKAQRSPTTLSGDNLLSDIEARVRAADCQGAEALARALSAKTSQASRAQSLVLAADCYYGHTNAPAALRLYNEVTHRFAKTAAAENAAYELGRVAREQGDAADALDAFRTYLSRYPKGVLASEALFRTCVLHYDGKRFDESLQCIRQYHRRHAGGKRSGDADLLEATIYRVERRDCQKALNAYDRYLARPGAKADEAKGWRDWCAKAPGTP